MKVRTYASGFAAAALVLASAGGAFAQQKPASAVEWMTVNQAKKTVDFTVNAGYGGANSGMDFNGYAKGQMVATVPQGWTVDVSFVNSGALPHSVVFEPWGENINSQTPKPAFAKAETPNPVAGTAPGGKSAFQFKATKAGKYRFLCAFPGHAQLGMWDTLIVKKGAATATLEASGHKLAVRTIGQKAVSHPKPKKTAKKPTSKADRWIRVLPKKKTVDLTVNAGYAGANSGMDFDGYAKGQMAVNVPLGWTVNVSFVNSGALPHSVVFEPWGENMNSQAPTPAFAKAETPNPVAGTAPGGKYAFHFKASKAGKYRFLCAFPGHAQLGMWDVMLVKKGLKTASVTAK